MDRNELDQAHSDRWEEIELSWGELICILLLALIFMCGIPAAVVYYTILPK